MQEEKNEVVDNEMSRDNKAEYNSLVAAYKATYPASASRTSRKRHLRESRMENKSRNNNNGHSQSSFQSNMFSFGNMDNLNINLNLEYRNVVLLLLYVDFLFHE